MAKPKIRKVDKLYYSMYLINRTLDNEKMPMEHKILIIDRITEWTYNDVAEFSHKMTEQFEQDLANDIDKFNEEFKKKRQEQSN